jgi:hypothetical protein
MYQQPGGGPFAVMLFCDDALGSNLGVICYAGHPCTRPPWDVVNRFWQEPRWATDVTAFAWHPNKACVYVSSSEIYGEGDVYALDLPDRLVTTLPLKTTGKLAPGHRYNTTLTRIDDEGRMLEYAVEYFDPTRSRTTTEVVTIPLPPCGSEPQSGPRAR